MHSSAASRIHPAGRAVALFAVSSRELAGRRIVVDGRRISALATGRLALLLCYVDPIEYGPGELERRRLDVAWQANEARIHERAVERASVHGSVLPLRPLTIVPDASALEAYAREHAARWSRSLARLSEKRECAVHLYAGPHVGSLDAPYLVRVVQRATRTSRTPALDATPEIAAYAQRLWGACTALAQAVRRVDSASRRGALWSAALLVAESDLEALREMLERTARQGNALGVTAYLEGPRPPFSFV